jgi:hypothetical protein
MKTISVIIILLLFPLSLIAQSGDTENVFLITLDGLRWQELYTGADENLITHEDYVSDMEKLKNEFWDENPETRKRLLMPFFWDVIAEKGQLYGNRNLGNRADVANNMVFSYPGYSELLTGFVDQRIDSNDKIPNPNITFLEYLNSLPGFENRIAAFGSWDVFPYIINEERSGVPVNAGFNIAEKKPLSDREVFLNKLIGEIPSPWSSVRLDAFTHHYAVEYIKKETPRVVYIAYGETDDFAHDGNYQEYLFSARRTDQFIRELWMFVQSHPEYKDKTSFIITTDHGRGTTPVDNWRNHGTDIEGAEEIWIAAIGPDIPILGVAEGGNTIYLNQIAQTVTRLLGTEYSGERQAGKPVRSILGEN